MIRHSAIEIWSRIPLEIKNKTCLALFSEEYKKYEICITQIIEMYSLFLLIGVHKPSGLI